jgi:hypothetical protein
MIKRKVIKWAAMLSSTAFLAIPGCEAGTDLINQLLGGLTGMV